ncbi:MAG TPA: tRNA (adenosine(37)-N6)-threonylcarbamoyltransferase complex transferase subunit TsaD [Candidatus Paceibacterota bacterium]|jgi:N6-L-threonylcarbamoyladenine synthase
MRILAIETSCDETAIAIVEGTVAEGGTSFTILGNALLSQIEVHREYGGVYPMLAKREHAKNLVPLLSAALEEAEMLRKDLQSIPADIESALGTLLEREGDLAGALLAMLREYGVPDIDAIAVTAGPGLEPALWVGVNFAKALALVWHKPLISVNHMEGHLLAALLQEQEANAYLLPETSLPLLGLLISGGHTEIVEMTDWLEYRLVGQTRDDAVGEAFDKVARMLALPYPGGPEISRLAERARERGGANPFTLPRPMLTSDSCDFSFSGLKTAVLYLVKDKELDETEKEDMALAFEEAVADVLYAKTVRAIEETGALSLAIGGGVSANAYIKRVFSEKLPADHPEVSLSIPVPFLTGDNAIMIALAGYFRAKRGEFADADGLIADGNRALGTRLK